MKSVLPTPHGDIPLPAFLPDATRAVVRTVDSNDLESAGVTAVVVNTYHLLSKPGVRILSSGGIHTFMGWDHPVVSDSGGFQIYSLLGKNPKLGSVTRDGFTWRVSKGSKRQILTPEKSIQRQFRLGADIMVCLDHCMHPDAPPEAHRESVENTVKWAYECRKEFDKLVKQKKIDESGRPLLFAVIQGGEDRDLRRECTERLYEIGFDGYSFGGWPLDDKHRLVESVGVVAELAPDGYPLFALGIASAEHIVAGFNAGYSLFDGALPTRDARRGRLLVYTGKPDLKRFNRGSFYNYLYIGDDRYSSDQRPVDESCDCLCCKKYSRAYIHHLFDIEDPLGYRLATIHNLRFQMRLMEFLHGNSNGSKKEEKPVRWDSNSLTIVEEIKKSEKYRYLCDETLTRVVDWASRRSESEKEIEKNAKKKLHQVYAVYFELFDYQNVRDIQSGFPALAGVRDKRPLCERMLETHKSTSERTPILDDIYSTIFEITGVPDSIFDIGCGLHPFSIPWMDLPNRTIYIGCEIDERIVNLLNGFFRYMGIKGEAQWRDIICRPDTHSYDLAFLMKMVPSLERQEKGISRKLIESINAKNIVVSFPTETLGGYDVGMTENYDLMFREIVKGLGFDIARIELPTELFFILRKPEK